MAIVVKNSPYILGIDLGTSNSAIAVYEKGEAKILPVNGDKTCPSVVNMRENGEIIVGRQARSRLMIDPDNTVASIKREIGSAWTKEFTGAPGKTYTPTDISAEILSKLVSGAEGGGVVDLRGTPRFAVICIPANFDDAQKTATREAGILANLEVLELLEEPVAAAIAYAMDRDRDQTILVYDLGGGTFDVSILQVKSAGGEPAKFDVLAKEGVRKLGGDDFDYALMEIANAQFTSDSGVDILDLKKDQGISAKLLREAQQKLKDATETAKRELTETLNAQITIPNLIKDEAGNVHNLDMEITRDNFNDAVRPLIEQSREAIERALGAAKLGIDDISRIILVGGSTRVPLVKQMLGDMFGKEPYSDTDPDTAVARGAAIYGATLGVPTDQVEDTGR
jgi:molecular chaperone DnaK